MHHIPILQDIAIIFGVGGLLSWLNRYLHIPSTISFLITGILLGPFGLGIITAKETIEVMAEIGIVLLLFTIGMEFSFGSIVKIKKEVFIGGTLQVIGTAVITYLIIRPFAPAHVAVFAGMFVALSSTAIVLTTIIERGELATQAGRASMAILVFQDLAIVPMMLLLPALSQPADAFWEAMGGLTLKAGVIIGGVLVLSRYAMTPILKAVAKVRSKEFFLIVIVGICAGVAYISGEMGLSLGLGAFLAGLILAETPYVHQAMSDIEPFRDLFTVFFFVSIGMLVDVEVVIQYPHIILGGIIGIVVLKAAIITVVLRMINYHWSRGLSIGLTLSQVGEFSIVLTTVAFNSDLLNELYFQLFLAVCLVSMAITPFLFFLSTKLRDRFSPISQSEQRKLQEMDESHLENHLVVIGYGVIGRSVVKAAKLMNLQYVVIELNPDTVTAQRRLGNNIIYGDATKWPIMEHINLMKASCLVVTVPDIQASRRIVDMTRHHTKELPIFVRTRFVSEVEALQKLGATRVIPDEYESSISIFTNVLNHYNIHSTGQSQIAHQLREADYEFLREHHGSTLTPAAERLPDGFTVMDVMVKDQPALRGQSLRKLELISRFGITVAAIIDNREQSAIDVNPDATLEDQHELILIGKYEDIASFSEYLKQATNTST